MSPSKLTAGRRSVLLGAAAAAAAPLARPAIAQERKLVVGVVLPLSGTFADQGRNNEDGIKVFQKIHGNKVGNITVETVTRDDQGPGSGDLSRRMTQELIQRSRAEIILGYSFTPNALSAASLLTEAKKPGIIINAATSVITERSPYFARVSMTLPQLAASLGTWAAKNGVKTVYTIVSDYGPGLDAETWFTKAFEAGGGKVIGGARTPVAGMEYSPFLQRAVEARPDGLFSFSPGGDVSVAFMKQTKERNIVGSGIKLMVTGDVVDDNLVPAMGDALDGVVSALHYQVELDNPENKRFLEAFREMSGPNAMPSYRTVQAYDGMALIYHALQQTGGKTDADSIMNAIKGARLNSPRGPILIDPATRDIVQNVYIRRGQRKDGRWANIAFETIEGVKDPAKA
ncbi:ABC transporter substrate-binding protein [Roseomonas indoligenes]|uniref:ABC transporter substrate-binding protein n=1 Tax=Roseomonas indoligenes TaxID=2820811 RepID=A0A940N0H8_9PROT|nr:ABC transporter substrate-binding protein [Pararoseomonas indoligenes]MBP0495621.1 ABC transporter substrate-binding protein [Pararoseomonas indoligenes]